MSARKDPIADAVELAEEMAERYARDMEEELSQYTYATARPKPEEAAAVVAMFYQKYPPEPWVSPDGQPVMESAWWLAVQEHAPEIAEGFAEGRALFLAEMQRREQMAARMKAPRPAAVEVV